jgi:hypothetical protein
MPLTVEQQKELAQFPVALRTLIEAELATGNSIVAIGHSFPAPPAGAYFKLAKKVSTRPRASGDGLNFYDRDTSIYSGEFTDAKRFYFVLEPPNPPPPEPDMDAIRAAAQGKESDLSHLAQRTPPSEPATIAKQVRKPNRGAQLPPHAILQSSTSTSASWLFHFQDKRPPHEIQFNLERQLMTLLPFSIEAGQLVYRAKVKITGARYEFLLAFVAALPETNCYSLRVDASWADMPATHHDYFSTESGSWFNLWTRDFMRASPTPASEGSPARYQKLREAAVQAEAHLTSVATVQQAIVTAMKGGASFATAHKEGGTNICWREGKFIRADYGESEERKVFSGEAEFLKFLRQFYDWDTSKNIYPHKVSDFEAWKLILRLLRPN